MKWYPNPKSEKKTQFNTTDVDVFINQLNEIIIEQNQNWFNLPEDQWHIALPESRQYDDKGNIIITPYFHG